MNQKKSDSTKTILVISVGFIIVFMITKLNWALWVSVSVGLIGIFSKYLSDKIDFLWMKLTWILSLIVPNIIMAIIFYVFLLPISVLSKIFGNKDSLKLRNKSESVYVATEKSFESSSFEKTW